VCTAGHLKGPARYTRLLRDLETLLAELGVSSPAEVRGLSLRRIRERKEKGLVAVTRPVVPSIDDAACNGCTRCAEACAYGAMRMEKVGAAKAGGKAAAKARVAPERCIGCGLCVSVCPTDAISQVYYGHSGLR
jgi:formate hydrogenlyase subunit 6/NADH:ubiquinone oxidoreductase subunit I